MGTTANYSWPTPVATDLVKDGWEAIKDLGDAADTTVKAVSDAQGLVHIETQTIGSGVSGISFDNVFSADYKNYRIVCYVENASSAGTFAIRLRASGTDDNASNYNWTGFGGVTAWGNNTASPSSYFQVAEHTTEENSFILDIQYPFSSSYKTFFQSLNTHRSREIWFYGGSNAVTTSFDGFSVIPTTGTYTGGIISVYGYKE